MATTLLILQYTVSGLMPLVSISILGGILAYKKIFTCESTKKIAAAYSNFFAPIFIFINLAGSIDTKKFELIWPLFFTPFLMILLGILISFIHSKLFKQVPNLSRVMACILTFSNIGNLPIVLMKGMCSPYGPLQHNSNCADANSYVSIQIFTYSIIIWSVGYSLIEKDKEEYLDMMEKQKLLEEGREVQITVKVSIWKHIYQHLFLPGPLSSVSGLIIGLIPGFNNIFYDKHYPLYALADSFLFIAIAGAVLGLISLGVTLYLLASDNKDISKTFIVSIILFKNFITPLCALGLVYLLYSLNLFGDNRVMLYVVFVSFCCPTALVVMILTQTHQYGVKETAWLMFWIYIFSFPSLVIFSYIFFIIF